LSFLPSLAALATAGCSVFFPGSGDHGQTTVTSTGCGSGPKNPVAPGGYYVNGNTVCTAEHTAHLFHGLDRPSLEFSPQGTMLSAADFQNMGTWKANAVRIALNQDYWLSDSPFYDANYTSRVDNAVAWAEEAGMDVILDLHWSDAGVLGSCTTSCQQLMPDMNSLTFWMEVAAHYKDDGRVLFELYNEPHDVSWLVWKSGGTASGSKGTFQAVGMQQLYDAIRATGAANLVVIGGLDFAYDLTGVSGSRISGYNIMYATHPYNNASEKMVSAFDQYWGFLTKTDPVIITEFGDTNFADAGSGCPFAYDSQVIAYADAHLVSWTAWAWYVGGCRFPSMITDWNGTPSAPGMVVKQALLGYGDPAQGGRRDGGPIVATDAGSGTDGPASDAAADGAPADDAGGGEVGP
jgi:hypothetical protein